MERAVAIPTCGEQRHQRARAGVAVAHLLGAAENGVVEGGRHGALHPDLLRVRQAAALKHQRAAADFYGRKAARPVALGGLVAFVAQAGQLCICGKSASTYNTRHLALQVMVANVCTGDTIERAEK